jgi:hypothetical protein
MLHSEIMGSQRRAKVDTIPLDRIGGLVSTAEQRHHGPRHRETPSK